MIPELQAWALSVDPNEVAMGSNVECDHRVPEVRTRQLADINLPDTAHLASPLRYRLKTYATVHNYNKLIPDFLEKGNDENIRPELNGEVNLVSVFKFNWTRHKGDIAAALGLGTSSARDLDGLVIELKRLFSDDADVGLGNTLKPAAKSFIDDFFQRRWGFGQIHGVWVGLWNEFEHLVPTIATTWLSAVGVQIPAAPALCLLLKYKAKDVYPLVRPTILDAGWYPEHFASPSAPSWCGGPDCAPSGGHPMNNNADRSLGLRSEYIHRDWQRKSSDVHAWAWVHSAPPPPHPLPMARSLHWELLDGNYAKIGNWLAKP